MSSLIGVRKKWEQTTKAEVKVVKWEKVNNSGQFVFTDLRKNTPTQITAISPTMVQKMFSRFFEYLFHQCSKQVEVQNLNKKHVQIAISPNYGSEDIFTCVEYIFHQRSKTVFHWGSEYQETFKHLFHQIWFRRCFHVFLNIFHQCSKQVFHWGSKFKQNTFK